jgi:hypothetical protein
MKKNLLADDLASSKKEKKHLPSYCFSHCFSAQIWCSFSNVFSSMGESIQMGFFFNSSSFSSFLSDMFATALLISKWFLTANEEV